jgi:hypothetical protein
VGKQCGDCLVFKHWAQQRYHVGQNFCGKISPLATVISWRKSIFSSSMRFLQAATNKRC